MSPISFAERHLVFSLLFSVANTTLSVVKMELQGCTLKTF